HRDLHSFPTRRSSDLSLSTSRCITTVAGCIQRWVTSAQPNMNRRRTVSLNLMSTKRGEVHAVRFEFLQLQRFLMSPGLLVLGLRSEEHTSELQSLAYL